MQRLLVTGGCGYLGRELVVRAPAHGWDVRGTWFERRPPEDGDSGGRTLGEVAGLDRSAGGDLAGEIDDIVTKMEAT